MNAMSHRMRFLIEGRVQGVGFRPFVYREACARGLTGWVRNNSQGVIIEVEGPYEAVADFQRILTTTPPPLARIESIKEEPRDLEYSVAFEIVETHMTGPSHLSIPADVGLCDDCRRELFDPTNTRYQYPFIACTQCGPRFTVVKALPYDRNQTTMSEFPLCSPCATEYHNPDDRRFHAEATGCPQCGPHVELLGVTPQEHWLDQTVHLLAQGKLLAIKGIGGYHLACAAWESASIQRLRTLKRRPSKPFALMSLDTSTARQFCEVSRREEQILASVVRPIVLLRKRQGVISIAPEVAPGLNRLGVMLPYAPIHELLLHRLKDLGLPAVLVMTSANLHGSPMIYRDEHLRELQSRVDAVVSHNRVIAVPADDSVVQINVSGRQVLRRARGFVPEAIPLPASSAFAILALGSHMKNTFCLAQGREAILSPHIGDLEFDQGQRRFHEVLAHMMSLQGFEPDVIAMDFHHGYGASDVVDAWPAASVVRVQHHHAHVASVMAEHNVEKVVGLALDGNGLGSDGAIWGGEVLVATRSHFTRAAHLRYVPWVGGERIVREPWRMAATYLQLIFGDDWTSWPLEFVHSVPRQEWRVLRQFLATPEHARPTSSTGRLFDAVAALVAGRLVADFEAQGALELEDMADPTVSAYALPDLFNDVQGVIDPFPLVEAVVRDLLRGEDRHIIAGRFHRTLAQMFGRAACAVAKAYQISEIAASGGVMQNRLFAQSLASFLQDKNCRLLINQEIPPNDGGLSFGQVVVAQASMTSSGLQTDSRDCDPVIHH
ncbi:MAG: carbamoyltransferase HypF [Sulfobacillus thermotolerans]|nr:carbamoyltransferase HypF [Sulfobacillus thermotolerans]